MLYGWQGGPAEKLERSRELNDGIYQGLHVVYVDYARSISISLARPRRGLRQQNEVHHNLDVYHIKAAVLIAITMSKKGASTYRANRH